MQAWATGPGFSHHFGLGHALNGWDSVPTAAVFPCDTDAHCRLWRHVCSEALLVCEWGMQL